MVKAHSLEVTVNRRYSNGLSANLAFSLNSVTRKPHGRGLRSRADDLAAEPECPAVPHRAAAPCMSSRSVSNKAFLS